MCDEETNERNGRRRGAKKEVLSTYNFHYMIIFFSISLTISSKNNLYNEMRALLQLLFYVVNWSFTKV
jgi:hypothetical protein